MFFITFFLLSFFYFHGHKFGFSNTVKFPLTRTSRGKKNSWSLRKFQLSGVNYEAAILVRNSEGSSYRDLTMWVCLRVRARAFVYVCV